MIHKHIKSLPHHPKRVIIISLIIALAVGIFGYIEINKKVPTPVVYQNDSGVSGPNSASMSNLTLGFLASGRIASVSVKAGDMVKKDQVLAQLDSGNTLGALTQAKAAYATAQANYQKVINGATGATIDVAKTAVTNAQTNLTQTTNQQKVLVATAYSTLLNSTPEIVPDDNSVSHYAAPTISGNYSLGTEGTIKVTLYNSIGGVGFTLSGLASGSGSCDTVIPQPLGNSGLSIKCASNNVNVYNWDIQIPNQKAPDYLANYNAYQVALQNQSQAVANAQAALDQATANLNSIVTAARPEDVATAQAQVDSALGAVQIAQAAYDNTIITAPADGKVISVSITPGEIAIPNAPAIEFISIVTPQ